MIKIPSLIELAQAGVHLGHKTSKRSPQMDPYIFVEKNKIHIIDLNKTRELLQAALNFISESISNEKSILFVGTKPAIKEIIKKYAEELNIPYINERWLGGTLTNFLTISKLIKKFNSMRGAKDKGEWEKYTKKERHELSKELNRLQIMVGGIKDLTKLPDIIYIVDIVKEKTAIRETRKAKVSVVAMVDTNANPQLAEWPIPSNDDAIKAVELITGLVAEAVKHGRKNIKKQEKKDTTEKNIKSAKNIKKSVKENPKKATKN